MGGTRAEWLVERALGEEKIRLTTGPVPPPWLRVANRNGDSCEGMSGATAPMDETLLRRILDRYLYPEELRELCDEHEESLEGTKEELVARVLTIEDFDPAEAVEYLDHRELAELAGELGLNTQGPRDELFDRVLARVAGNPPP